MTNAKCPPLSTAQKQALDNVQDECAMLGALKMQLINAMTGRAPIEVRFSDRTVRYAQPNVVELRKQIAYYERLCNPLTRNASAVRMGGYPPRFGRYGGNGY